MKHTFFNKHKVLIISFAAAVVLAGCAGQKMATPTPTPSTSLSAKDIRTAIDTGAAAREKGDYQTGETQLAQAFESAINLKDKALSIEAGNNLSIQYRLSAGRANRNGKLANAQNFSTQSLGVYKRLKDLGWFDEKDPNIARNWAHALLYAGKVDQAIPALKASLALQTNAAAKGDEMDHLAAAALSQNRIKDAQNFSNQGIRLIEQNKGSKVWETFGLMVQATLLSKGNNGAQAKMLLQHALDIATQNALAVRQEELKYLIAQPVNNINVLQSVGTPS